jgi:tetratricopeptide (TPR) repeat protein
MAAHSDSRLDEAARLYREVLALKPDHGDALNNLSLLERERGNLVAALRLSEAAVAALEHPRFLENLGLFRAESGDSAAAEAAYLRGLEIAPDDPALLSALLNLYVDLERYEAAAICNERLIRLTPDLAQLQTNQGGFAHIAQQFDRAVYHYQLALRLDPLHRVSRRSEYDSWSEGVG